MAIDISKELEGIRQTLERCVEDETEALEAAVDSGALQGFEDVVKQRIDSKKGYEAVTAAAPAEPVAEPAGSPAGGNGVYEEIAGIADLLKRCAEDNPDALKADVDSGKLAGFEELVAEQIKASNPYEKLDYLVTQSPDTVVEMLKDCDDFGLRSRSIRELAKNGFYEQALALGQVGYEEFVCAVEFEFGRKEPERFLNYVLNNKYWNGEYTPVDEDVFAETVLLEHYALHYPDELVEKVEGVQGDFDLLTQAVHALSAQKWYEHALELAESVQPYIEVEDIAGEFASCFPADALIFGARTDREEVFYPALEMFSYDDASDESVLDAYVGLTEQGYSSHLKRFADAVGDSIFQYGVFGEIHQRAVEVNDSYMMAKIAHALKEDEPEEALMLAEASGEFDLECELREALDVEVPYLEEYADLVSTAHSIIQLVAQDFSVKLPTNVSVGGPEGSYASIRYSRFNGEQDGIGA